MSLNLFDGAVVRLRNGEVLTIRANEGNMGTFPWKGQTDKGRVLTWTKYGTYLIEAVNQESPLDIIGLNDELVEPMQPEFIIIKDRTDGNANWFMHDVSKPDESKIDAMKRAEDAFKAATGREPELTIVREKPIERTESKRRVFMTEEGAVEGLCVGAKVTLRNGKVVTLAEGPNMTFPWTIAERSHIDEIWTEEGKYSPEEGHHPCDIVSFELPEEPKADPLFDRIPYKDFVGFQTTYGPAKFVTYGGKEFSGLTILQDEMFTSQREYVWDRMTGEVKVTPTLFRACFHGFGESYCYDDISHVLVPKAPAELAKPSDYATVGEAKVECGIVGEYVTITNTGGTSIYVDGEHVGGPEGSKKLIDTVNEEVRKQNHVKWDKSDDPDYRETVILRTNASAPADFPEINYSMGRGEMFFRKPAPLFADRKPSKVLLKLMKQMAKQVGGKFAGYEWNSSSGVDVKIDFRHKLRTGGSVDFSNTITLDVSGLDGNAYLPTRKV